LSLAITPDFQAQDIVRLVQEHDLASDTAAIVGRVFGTLDNHEKLCQRLEELMVAWTGPAESNPIYRALTIGHQQTEAVLRLPWHPSHQQRGSGRNESVYWVDWVRWMPHRAFGMAVTAFPNRFRSEMGFVIGKRIAEAGREVTSDEICKHLPDVCVEASATVVEEILPAARLWGLLRILAKYEEESWKRETELVGLRARVAAYATEDPDLWAEALPWILFRARAFGDVAQAVTLELTSTSGTVRRALELACDNETETVRLVARGLRALLDGVEDPGVGLARTLADAAARHMDGTPVFPHPLSPISATWLASTGVETAISDGVRRAVQRFSSEVRDQGADIEPALTKALVKEIEIEFRETLPRLRALGTARSRQPIPALSLKQRPVSPTSEEPVYGCDLALLLNATVSRRFRATWADLIQVKKSKAIQPTPSDSVRTDSWTIARKQLADILKWSASSAYWLIAGAGEVLVVPARFLAGIESGSNLRSVQKTFTVGYHEVRSAAIPVERYLVDLLIGQWIGTSDESVLRFVRGEDSSIRPRIVLDVEITIGHQTQDQ
jgi:hypothetical protein